MMTFHITAVATLAQIVVTLRSGRSLRSKDAPHIDIRWCHRIYAVTERNKLLSGALCIIVIAQLSWGIYYLTETAVNPRKFFELFFSFPFNGLIGS